MSRADRQRDKSQYRGPQRIGNVVARLMARRGYARVESVSACHDAWQQAAGKQLGGQSRAGMVRRGTLEVTVGNSAALQELTFRKKQLVAELNRLLPEERIRNVRFRVGALD